MGNLVTCALEFKEEFHDQFTIHLAVYCQSETVQQERSWWGRVWRALGLCRCSHHSMQTSPFNTAACTSNYFLQVVTFVSQKLMHWIIISQPAKAAGSVWIEGGWRVYVCVNTSPFHHRARSLSLTHKPERPKKSVHKIFTPCTFSARPATRRQPKKRGDTAAARGCVSFPVYVLQPHHPKFKWNFYGIAYRGADIVGGRCWKASVAFTNCPFAYARCHNILKLNRITARGNDETPAI